MTAERPAYMSIARLASELCVSESTVSELVRRGVIPQPCELSPGTIRWRWADVDAALALRQRGAAEVSDPFIMGALNAKKGQGRGGRAA